MSGTWGFGDSRFLTPLPAARGTEEDQAPAPTSPVARQGNFQSQRFLFKENMDMEVIPLPPPPTCFVFFAQVSVGLGCQVRPPFDLSKYGARFSKQSCVGCWAELKKEPLFP